MKLHWLVPLTLVFACGKTEEGDGGSGDSSGSSSGDMTTTMTVTVTASTTMSTTDTTTMTTGMTDPTSTTEPTTTDPDSSGSGSSGTDPTSGTESSGSDSGSSSSTGGEPVSYGPCDFTDMDNPTCPNEGEVCNDLGQFGEGSWCAMPCEMGDPDGCAEPPSGDAAVECSMLDGNPCALNCVDATCPDGMDCVVIVPGMIERCAWPPA